MEVIIPTVPDLLKNIKQGKWKCFLDDTFLKIKYGYYYYMCSEVITPPHLCETTCLWKNKYIYLEYLRIKSKPKEMIESKLKYFT